MKKLGVMVALGMAVTACGPTQDTSATSKCDQARDHLQACFQGQEARVPESCDDTSAAQILSQDCDGLARAEQASSDGKADGFCNPWFWWLCSFEPTPEEPEETGYSINLNISICQSDLCVEELFNENRRGAYCGKITLHDAAGDIVATDYVSDWVRNHPAILPDFKPGFHNLDVPAGLYTARLWRRDGDQARTVKGEPAQVRLSFEEDGDVVRLDDDSLPLLDSNDFRVLTEEADLIRACTDVIGSTRSTCDGEPMEIEDQEWGWIVELEGETEQGSYRDLDRARDPAGNVNRYDFLRVRKGTYKLTFHEVDVPSWRRKNNRKFEDYEEILDRDATGRTITETIEITDADLDAERTSFSTIELDHQDCF